MNTHLLILILVLKGNFFMNERCNKEIKSLINKDYNIFVS